MELQGQPAMMSFQRRSPNRDKYRLDHWSWQRDAWIEPTLECGWRSPFEFSRSRSPLRWGILDRRELGTFRLALTGIVRTEVASVRARRYDQVALDPVV